MEAKGKIKAGRGGIRKEEGRRNHKRLLRIKNELPRVQPFAELNIAMHHLHPDEGGLVRRFGGVDVRAPQNFDPKILGNIPNWKELGHV
jgi:hypothetical protein